MMIASVRTGIIHCDEYLFRRQRVDFAYWIHGAYVKLTDQLT